MKFGLYMVKKGVITPAQLVLALEKQHSHQRPLGQLAMEEGILSARQVFKILRCQSGMPHERFGEVAVGMRMMTHEQLERLLMIQWERKPSLEDILVRQRILTQSQLDDQLAAYRAGNGSKERRHQAFDRDAEDSGDADAGSAVRRGSVHADGLAPAFSRLAMLPPTVRPIWRIRAIWTLAAGARTAAPASRSRRTAPAPASARPATRRPTAGTRFCFGK